MSSIPALAASIARRALDRPDAERRDYAVSACGGDDALRDATLALLARIVSADARLDAGADLPVADPLVGRQFGAYRLIERVGRGGMGVVYRAERTGADFAQHVAIKLIRDGFEVDEMVARFLRERRILAHLSHPNLARLIDGGVADGRPWFALEFVDGEPITRACDRRRATLRERVALIVTVCRAVQYAHTQLVVHRDLKPGNILVDRDGRAKVLDFGIAKRIDGEADLTRAGALHGFTPHYAAPELVTGAPVGVAVDVYSLGVILYELVAGRLPYELDADNLQQTVAAITQQRPLRLTHALRHDGEAQSVQRLSERRVDARAFDRAARGDLARIVDTALAKEPQRRYASVAALADDLERWLAGRPVTVAGDSWRYRAALFVRRNAIAVAASALLVVSVVAGVAGTVWQARETAQSLRSAAQLKNYLIDMLQQADADTPDRPLTAQAIVDRGAGYLDSLPHGSRVRLELVGTLVALYRGLGQSARAAALAERELGDPPDWPDPADPAFLAVLSDWANTSESLGPERSGVARTRLTQAAAQFPDRDSLVLADALQTLGSLYGGADREREAAAYQAQALAIVERRAPHGDLRLPGARVLLAGALTTLRHLGDARALTERALTELPAADSRSKAYVNNMAALRRAVFGEFASAETLYDNARQILARLGDPRLSSYYHATHANNAYDLGDFARIDTIAAQLTAEYRARGAEFEVYELDWLRGEAALAQGEPRRAAERFALSLAHGARMPQTLDGARFARYVAALRAVALVQAGDAGAMQALPPAIDAALPPTYADAMALAAQAAIDSRAGRHVAALAGFEHALRVQAQARLLPIVVHDQLKENRDIPRLRLYYAQALDAAGESRRAAIVLAEARALAQSMLGAEHPVTRQITRYTAGTR